MPSAFGLAAKRGTGTDSIVSGVSLLGYSIPTFWLGQLLILLFAVIWTVLPAGGMVATRLRYVGFDHVIDVAEHLILPVVSLAAFELGLIARFTRSAMIDAMNRDYVLVAFAKGRAVAVCSGCTPSQTRLLLRSR